MNEIAIIEMPLGTKFKYEICKNTGSLLLDRYIGLSVPFNYGFIPNTLSEDNDPLDIFVISEEPIHPLTKVQVVPVGVIECLDNGESDDKVVSIIKDSYYDYNNLENDFMKIINYLNTYKAGFDVIDFDYLKVQEIINTAKINYEKILL